MAEGNIKWFNAEKGYGFIKPGAGGADVFVHISKLQESGINPETLRGEDKNKGRMGEKVSFDIKEERGRNGEVRQSAINLKLIAEAG